VLTQPLLGTNPERAEQRARMVASAFAEAFAVLASLRSAVARLLSGFFGRVYLMR
jgi:hypothetical protein